MNVRFEINTQKAQAELLQAARRIATLPESPTDNPVMLAMRDYQDSLRTTRRPTGSASGSYYGEPWPAWKPAYVRKDGTVVPIWGGVSKKRGKGKVKGRIKSEGTGRGSGSRYRSDDLQLGARAGGLWSDWITQKARLSDANKTATLTSPFAYSAKQFDRRSWFGEQLKQVLADRLVVRMERYLKDLLQ